jgi:XisI protein
MDSVTTNLAQVVSQTVRSYATRGYSAGQPSRLYYVENVQDQVFSVVAPYNPNYERADLVILARIVKDQIIIEADKTSKPLYDELRRAGIPEGQIVLACQRNC